MLSFTLPDSFIEPYATRPVDWGYPDAAGNSLGEITMIRTYSRKKEDGTKERWHEVCRRVIEGMFSLQKDYAKANRLPWSDRKAQRTAQDAYERLFTFKWTPPGRGLWVMGTPLVNEKKNSAALQNCFGADATFLTDRGVRGLGEAAGSVVEVLTEKGWAQAEVNSFGVQAVQRVTLAPAIPTSSGAGWRAARSNVRKTVTVTPDHRWVLADGTVTTDLQIGAALPAIAAEVEPYGDEYRRGLAHGIVFADGAHAFTYADGTRRYEVRLCGAKADSMYDYDADQAYSAPSHNGDPTIVFTHVADDWKALPVGKGPAYLAGFLAGWIKGDGSATAAGTIALGSQHPDAGAWLDEHAALGGWLRVGYSSDDRDTNYGPRSAPLVKHVLARAEGRAWKVVGIEPLDEPQEVFCATVPSTSTFTLAGGVLTGNCAFVSTADIDPHNPSEPFAFLMEASMLGIGVGFDVRGADLGLKVHRPRETDRPTHVIPDSREGWVSSTALLINSYLVPDREAIAFDYSLIRDAGELIKGFGGTAAGPEPLVRLHDTLRVLLSTRSHLDAELIADVCNLIGVCVVSGNVRRSAELMLGKLSDKGFLDFKNYDSEIGQRRGEWGWMSNNSVDVEVGEDLSEIHEGIALNGEPGVVWMDVSRAYGRLVDPPNHKDHRASGYNPCAEQTLESYECCTLVETYVGRHESLEDFKKTLKVAYLYGKTVTLLPTHWERTNSIMQRNRRIGTSISGIANFADNRGLPMLREWMDRGYAEVQRLDTVYSEWLCVRESIKTTTVKPSGTVSILAGESPGVHWAPGGEYFERAIRFSKDDPMLPLFQQAGYRTVWAERENAEIVFFPVRSRARRSEQEVSLYEKANLAVLAQRYWSDNSVSVTLSFDPETEADDVARILQMHEGQLKTVSFLPMLKAGAYENMPYTPSTLEEHERASMRLFKVDLGPVYDGTAGLEAAGEAFCTTDACEVKDLTAA